MPAGLSLVLALVLWNVIAGALISATPVWYTDPIRGRLQSPGTYVASGEGWSTGRIDNMGFRGPDVGPKKPGTLRVLVLGDSNTEAEGVTWSDTYVAQLQKKLEKDLGRPVEVLNAGRSGAGVAEYLNLAPFYMSALKPDVVVAQVGARSLSSSLMAADDVGFEATRAPDGSYTTTHTPFVPDVPRSMSWWRNRILAVPLIRSWADNLRPEVAPSKAEAPVDRQYVAFCVRELKRLYPRLVMLYVASPDYQDPAVAPVPTEVAAEGAAAREGVPLVDLRRPFLAAYQRTGQYPQGFANSVPGAGHMNEAGHRIAAELLAAKIEGVLR